VDARPGKLRLRPVLEREDQLIRARYQTGSLMKRRRADGKTWWILRYRITDQTGKRVLRQREIGTTEQYKTESQAQRAADAVRLQINNNSPAVQLTTVGVLAEHFKTVELTDEDDRRSWSTKQNYKDMIDGWIVPKWGNTGVMDVKTIAIEDWLKRLRRKDGSGSLADPTKQRIRNVFSVMFTHGQRYELVPKDHNPVTLVRQSGKRSKVPDILEPEEINLLWSHSAPRERAAISMEFGNGLRISEGIALIWTDISFANGTASVTKGMVKGHIGSVKTEVSKKLVPLHAYQLEDLKAWRAVAPYAGDDDWVSASHVTKGERPYWPDMILKHHIKPLAKRLGIKKRIGWHTFRRSFASILKANGEDVKVVQELCRHANPNVTLALYAQAFSEDARKAQSKVIEMVRKMPLPIAEPASNQAISAIVH
jgi:integrase